jgi:selenocysteine lyase/cysteine desulfurase
MQERGVTLTLPMKLPCQKHLFTIDEQTHYFNCAYKAPLLKSAELAAHEELKMLRTPSQLKPDDFFDDAAAVKSAFALLTGSSPDQIAILPSTSYGFSSVLNNIAGKQNGKAITLEDEFPSGVFAMQRWCADQNQELQFVGPGKGEHSQGTSWNQRILESIDDATSVVLISSIQWINGIKFNLEAIGDKCHAHGAVFIVDGTQSVGVLEIDVNRCRIDALVCASYKWLFGPYSVALAHIGPRLHGGRPLEESWMNRTNSAAFHALTEYDSNYIPGAGRYDVGEKSNLILMPMLKVALEQVAEWTPRGIEAYCSAVTQPLKPHMAADDPCTSNHLFTLKLPPETDHAALRHRLQERNIILSQRGPNLRVSVHLFNDERDISTLLEVLEEA